MPEGPQSTGLHWLDQLDTAGIIPRRQTRIVRIWGLSSWTSSTDRRSEEAAKFSPETLPPATFQAIWLCSSVKTEGWFCVFMEIGEIPAQTLGGTPFQVARRDFKDWGKRGRGNFDRHLCNGSPHF